MYTDDDTMCRATFEKSESVEIQQSHIENALSRQLRHHRAEKKKDLHFYCLIAIDRAIPVWAGLRLLRSLALECVDCRLDFRSTSNDKETYISIAKGNIVIAQH